jgi:hypothetical protein
LSTGLNLLRYGINKSLIVLKECIVNRAESAQVWDQALEQVWHRGGSAFVSMTKNCKNFLLKFFCSYASMKDVKDTHRRSLQSTEENIQDFST